jgi:hypothetical protein
MPQINLIPEVLYEPNQPYHYLYDNIPLKNILARISLVNIQVDKNAAMLIGTAGSAGSLVNRLDVSLKEDGSLRTEAVDNSQHSIDHHTDSLEYVRMKADERAKLFSINSNANHLTLQVDENQINSGNVEFRNSTTIFFEVQSPNIIRAHSYFPSDVAHRHVYGIQPVHQNSTPNWKNFRTTLFSTAYMEGSLRVYINGIRILNETRVPIFSGSPNPSWNVFYIESENHETGDFVLNSAIPQPGNEIRIDFDTQFVPS